MTTKLNVAVIGAGMAGLVAARELHREGHRVTVYEKSHQLGGTWLYDSRTESDQLGIDPNRLIIHSSMYESLRVNLPRNLMEFLDYPFKVEGVGNGRWFPGHREVLKYLKDFAVNFGLLELIRFGCEVVGISRESGGGDDSNWIVESRGVEDLEMEVEMIVYEAVVICNGKHTEPRLADFKGQNVCKSSDLHHCILF